MTEEHQRLQPRRRGSPLIGTFCGSKRLSGLVRRRQGILADRQGEARLPISITPVGPRWQTIRPRHETRRRSNFGTAPPRGPGPPICANGSCGRRPDEGIVGFGGAPSRASAYSILVAAPARQFLSWRGASIRAVMCSAQMSPSNRSPERVDGSLLPAPAAHLHFTLRRNPSLLTAQQDQVPSVTFRPSA